MTRRRLPLTVLAALLGGAVLARPQARVGSDAVGDTGWPAVQVVTPLPAQIDWNVDLALDRDGNIVLTGVTRSPTFPTTPDAVDRTCGAEGDAFVLVYSPMGAMRYSTCLGGTTSEYWPRVAPAPDGSIWVAVNTSLEPDPYGGFSGGRVALWRLKPGVADYGQLAWLGGPGTLADLSDAKAGADGSVWVLGSTHSTYVPAVNAWQPTFGGGWSDMLLARYAPGRPEPLLLTYLGGREWESAVRLVIAPDGDAILSGCTYSPDFPMVKPAQPRLGGGQDLVLARVDVSGRWLEYSTYLGGTGDEDAVAMGVDQAGRVYLAGRAASADFPVTAPEVPRNLYRDVFFASIDEIGRLQSLTLMPTATERVAATDVGASARLVAPRPDGSVFVLGAYRSDNLLRAGAFRALVDASGALLRVPELLDIGEGDGSFVEASAAGVRYAYFVKMMWSEHGELVRWLLRTRLGPAEPDSGTRGNSRGKR
jgi:hypothetical protein